MKFYMALWLAKIINLAISLIDKKRGTNLPGEKALAIDPLFVKHFKNIDYSKVIFITGTNGKSTATNLITHILRKNGLKIVSNLEGANLLAGIATILAKNASLSGKIKADYFIFETDERFLPLIYEQFPAKNMLITNLQKDQVQRNGDPDFIVRKIKEVLHPDLRLILNNEEPRSRPFEQFVDQVIYYGIDDHLESFQKDWTYPTLACPFCSHDIVFVKHYIDNTGPFSCGHCGYKSQDNPDYQVKNIDFSKRSFTMNDVTFDMPYDLPFMLYNYAGALAVCDAVCHVSIGQAASAFASFENIAGRFEILKYKNKTIHYMRIKQENPDTLQSALNIVASDKKEKMLLLGLYKVDDFTPAYSNTFYTFDCDFQPVVSSKVETYLCFSEDVAYDTANRLLYEGVEVKDITILNSDAMTEIFKEIDKVETDNIYMITWLSTFYEMKKYIEGGEKA